MSTLNQHIPTFAQHTQHTLSGFIIEDPIIPPRPPVTGNNAHVLQ
jgi:hypothetical protein